MLKALIKKQLLEICAIWFRDRKTGKMRTGKSLVGMIVLMLFLFGGLAFSFFGISMGLASSFLYNGYEWLYFAVTGGMALALGVFGDVFNSYASLYLSKDNELLLSLPVKYSDILFSRMTGVYITGFIYEAIVFIPSVTVYAIKAEKGASVVVFPLLLLFVIALLVLALTCVLAYFVAKISKKMKGKAVTTALVAVLFIGIYYFASFKTSSFLQEIANNPEKISGDIKKYVYPLYILGQACTGNIPCFLTAIAVIFVFTFAVYLILSKSFVKILSSADEKKKNKVKTIKTEKSSLSSALLKREFLHLLSSSSYMLNCGLGLVILLVVSVVAIIKKDFILAYLSVLFYEMPQYSDLIAPAVAFAVMLVLSSADFTAASISLEGKNLWILKSLPLSGADILKAKLKMHIILTLIPGVICTFCLSYATDTDIISAVGAVCIVALFCVFNADMGLIMNLKRPDLVWMNENVPIKQSMSILFTMLINFAVACVFFGSCIACSLFFTAGAAMYSFIPLFLAAVILLKRFITVKGVAVFENL